MKNTIGLSYYTMIAIDENFQIYVLLVLFELFIWHKCIFRPKKTCPFDAWTAWSKWLIWEVLPCNVGCTFFSVQSLRSCSRQCSNIQCIQLANMQKYKKNSSKTLTCQGVLSQLDCVLDQALNFELVFKADNI